MRICSPQMGLSPLSGLGGTVYDRHILKGLAALGVEIEIPLPKGMLYEDVNGWRIHRMPRHLLYYYEYNLLFLPCLFRLWRKPGFDLLRVHSPTIGLLGWLFKRLTRERVVAHYHHLENHRIKNLINRIAIKSYDLITTDSRFCVEQLVTTFGIDRERAVVIYPGVGGEYHPISDRAGLEKRLGVVNRKVLFYLGSLKPRKNLLFLIDVFKAVHKREPSTRLVIGGCGSQERRLKDRVSELGLSEKVIFPGHIPEDEKVAYYNLADVFVLPSLLEGFGMVAAEAMACGTPVVASNVCSLPELIADGKTGLLADPRDVDDFAEKILRMLSSGDLREQMGRAGREWALSNFSWNAAAAKTKAVYEGVLQTR